MSLYVLEEWNERRPDDSLVGLGESSVYETGMDKPSDVYRFSMRQYGRCTGRIYIDGPSGNTLHIGWVFLKRVKYEDSNETYLQETWITVHDGKPTRTITYDYHIIKGKY